MLDPPQTISFAQQDGGQLQNVTSLQIKNTSATNNLAYKVKTTAPRSYQVKPFQGIINP
jgi:hypothetical protein